MRVVLTRREALDSPDGVSIFIVALAQALCELQHEVKIVVGCLQSVSEFERLLAPRLDLSILALSRTPLSGPASVVAWLRGKRAIDRFAPDIVIHSEAIPLPFTSFMTLSLGGAASRRCGGPFAASAPGAAIMWLPQRSSSATNSCAIWAYRRTRSS
jgi:hypothetical protein